MPKHERIKFSPLREKMLHDAILILRSVAFYEKEINRIMSLIDEAENNHFDADLPDLQKQLTSLVFKIGKENAHMDNFILKYKKIIQDEKSKALCH